ncbi:uncharacterized protein LOC117650766 [Thrips palmi]|uniref:Uncharacterized protein LOC117650766 n=1 Tax=Thrips palmi TaxID=161013 RepID=A0A6P8ZXX0_THRPL|nr:uncharacterized protein LOC117650766 [Thrips palmi]
MGWPRNSSSHFNPAKPYDPQIVTGTVTIPLNVDDSFWISGRIAKRANNQWKENYFVTNRFPMGFCSAVRSNVPEAYSKLFKPKSMTGLCSIAKGSYSMDHEPVRYSLANFPTLPYGTFFMRLKGQQLVKGVPGNEFELDAEFDTWPRP